MGVDIKNKWGAPQRLIAVALAALLSGITLTASADAVEDLLNKLRDKGILSQEEYDEMLKESRAEQKNAAVQQAQTEQAAQQAQQAAQQAAAAPVASNGGVKIKIGGFIESASIYRSENEVSDVASVFTAKGFNTAAGAGIPYSNTPQAQTPEFRESARQSRISLLATGNPDDNTALAAYFETDFLGAAQTANSNQSNSYNLRLRQAYGTWDQSEWGVHFLGGQSWSLATQFKDGLTPRDENVPLTIDAQYAVGFNWLRVPQLRLVKDFDKKYWLGLSLETPAAIVAGTAPSYFTSLAASGLANPAAGTTFTAAPNVSTLINETGGSLYYNGNAYTTDTRPDIILKGAADPGWGHYELYGLYRWFTDRTNDPSLGPLAAATTGSGINSTTNGHGIGGSVLLPVVPKMLSVSGSFLTGDGIGRYGTSQLPDVTYNLNGTLATIHETDFLFGAIFNPAPAWQIWGYYGREIADQTAFENKPFDNPIIFANQPGLAGAPPGSTGYFNPYITTFSGYGLPVLQNYGCYANPAHVAGSATNCEAVTAATQEWTIGAWWNFYKGPYGTVKWGASFQHNSVDTYAGLTGAPSPSINVYMLSFRYYPFQ